MHCINQLKSQNRSCYACLHTMLQTSCCSSQHIIRHGLQRNFYLFAKLSQHHKFKSLPASQAAVRNELLPDSCEATTVSKVFPEANSARRPVGNPKSLIHNLMQVSKNYGKPMNFSFSTTQSSSSGTWTSQLKMLQNAAAGSSNNVMNELPNDDDQVVFHGTHARKHAAEANAALNCIAFLMSRGVFDKKGQIVMQNQERKAASRRQAHVKTIDLKFSERQQDIIKQFLVNYEAKIAAEQAATVTAATTVAEEPAQLAVATLPEQVHVLTNAPYAAPTPQEAEDINVEISKHRLQHSSKARVTARERMQLPISVHRERLLSVIRDNQVVIVAGETGSGKSTQLPQFILDDHIDRNRGAECGVIVTQPRRISTLSLSARVAAERGETIGESVGYQVRLESCLPKRLHGFIFYCTTGTLNNFLRGVPAVKQPNGLTHLIIDEVHIRDVHIDFLLAAVKQMLPSNPNLRVILMSASMNYELLQRHFDNCPVVKIPGSTYAVTEYFLPDVLQMLSTSHHQKNDDIINATKIFEKEMRIDPTHLFETSLILDTIEFIDKHRPPGAVLCFLPGWVEIQFVDRALRASKFYNSGCHVIHRLHSKIPLAKQNNIFRAVGEKQRKIILATNIAESSITINDVRYVIDTGLQRETSFDANRSALCLQLTSTSKSNTIQRRGRAGRVSNGECFYLFTREHYAEQMRDFPVPEIKRMSLETVCLDSKLLSPDASMPVAEFLRNMPEPPSASDVADAVRRLTDLGIFAARKPPKALAENASGTGDDSSDSGEELTPLGRRIAHFSSHPRMSIALLYAALLRCIGPVITAAALYTSTREPFLDTFETRAEIQKRKRALAPDCDWEAMSMLMRVYREARLARESRTEKSDAEETFLKQYQLDAETMSFIEASREIYVNHLRDAYMLGNDNWALEDETTEEKLSPFFYRENENELSSAHVRAAICAGYGDLVASVSNGSSDQSNLFRTTSTTKRVLMLDEGRWAEVATNSAVDVRNLPDSSLIAYVIKRSLMRRRSRFSILNDAAHVHPLHVLLFSRRLTPRTNTDGAVDTNRSDRCDGISTTIECDELPYLKFRCETLSEAENLLKLRKAIHGVVELTLQSTNSLDRELLKLIAEMRALVEECMSLTPSGLTGEVS